MIAERLGWPAATLGATLDRLTDDQSHDSPRYRCGKSGDRGVLAGNRQCHRPVRRGSLPLDEGDSRGQEEAGGVLTLADLGIDSTTVGLDAAWSKVRADDPASCPRRRAALSSMRTAPDRRLCVEFLTARQHTSERARLLMSEVLIVADQVDSSPSPAGAGASPWLAGSEGRSLWSSASPTRQWPRRSQSTAPREVLFATDPCAHRLSRRAEGRSTCADRGRCGRGRDPDQLHPGGEGRLRDGLRSNSSLA